MEIRPELDPPVSQEPPEEERITDYDRRHMVTYLRLMDAESAGADWREVARIVMHLDPDADELRARRLFDSHMRRVRWLSESGYRHLLAGGQVRHA